MAGADGVFNFWWILRRFRSRKCFVKELDVPAFVYFSEISKDLHAVRSAGIFARLLSQKYGGPRSNYYDHWLINRRNLRIETAVQWRRDHGKKRNARSIYVVKCYIMVPYATAGACVGGGAGFNIIDGYGRCGFGYSSASCRWARSVSESFDLSFEQLEPKRMTSPNVAIRPKLSALFIKVPPENSLNGIPSLVPRLMVYPKKKKLE